MALINRYRLVWQGFPGAPGYTNLYCLDSFILTFAPAVRTFMEAVKAGFPTGLSIQYPSSYDVIDDSTGNIVLTNSLTPPANTGGTGAGNYAGSAGAVVNWLTSDFVAGHRKRGRSFLVPIVAAQMDTAGSLNNTFQQTIQTAGTALITATAPNFVIWRQPTPGFPGSSHAVTACTVPDLAAVLRSRRS